MANAVHGPRSHTTVGLVLLGCACAALALVLVTLAALSLDEPWSLVDDAVRLAVALLGCLAAITAEALLFARPWASRAAKVLVAGCFAAVVGSELPGGFGHALVVALGLAVVGLIFIFPLLTYIHHQLAPGAYRGPRSRPFP
jgi:hypothetical protein